MSASLNTAPKNEGSTEKYQKLLKKITKLIKITNSISST